MYNFEIKKKIVMNGGSRIFKNWNQLVPNLTEEMFIDALKWVCEDPKDEKGRLTREIGLTKNGIVKLKRSYDQGGMCAFYYQKGKLWHLWYGSSFKVPCDKPAFADENGMTTVMKNISLSARDSV